MVRIRHDIGFVCRLSVVDRPTKARGESNAFRSMCYAYRGNNYWQLKGFAMMTVIFS